MPELIEVDLDLLQLLMPLRARDDTKPTPEEIETMRQLGVTTPPCARPIPGTQPQRYELLTGASTWEAAQIAGLPRIPVYVREDLSEADEKALTAISITTPLARSQALKALAQGRGEQSRLAARLKVSRSHLSHYRRLARLPAVVRAMIEREQLNYGQARALLRVPTADGQTELARLAVARRLPVRKVEAAAQRMRDDHLSARHAVDETTSAKQVSGPTVATSKQDPDITSTAAMLTESMGSPVEIVHRADGSGTVIIHYHDLDVLDGIIDRLSGCIPAGRQADFEDDFVV